MKRLLLGIFTVFGLFIIYFSVNYSPTVFSVFKQVRILKVERNTTPLVKQAKAKEISLPLKNTIIKIYKSKRILEFFEGKTLIKTYPMSLGFQPVGNKEKEGDGKTPEGEFYISQKAMYPVKKYLGTRWMRISYPSRKHAKKGLYKRLINKKTYSQIVETLINSQTPPQNTKLGGGIGIHGGTDKILGGIAVDWTAGCIGLYDKDAEEIYNQVKVGTKIYIYK